MANWNALELRLGVRPGRQLEVPSSSALQSAWSHVRDAASDAWRLAAAEALPHLLFLSRHRHVLYISDADSLTLFRLLEKADRDSDVSVVRETGGATRLEEETETVVSDRKFSLERCCFLLLCVWFRRATAPGKTPRKTQSTGSENVDSIGASVENLIIGRLLSSRPLPFFLVSAGVLCLGSICSSLLSTEGIRDKAREALLQVLTDRGWGLEMEGFGEVLAGFGYAMSVSHGRHSQRLFTALLNLWFPRNTSKSMAIEILVELPSLEQGFLLVELMEHEGLRLRSLGESSWPEDNSLALSILQGLVAVSQRAIKGELAETSDRRFEQEFGISKCAGIMCVVGLLRGLGAGKSGKVELGQVNRLPSSSFWCQEMELVLQGLVAMAAADASPWLLNSSHSRHSPEIGVVEAPKLKDPFLIWESRPLFSSELYNWMPASLTWAPAVDLSLTVISDGWQKARAKTARHWLRCVALAVSRLYGSGVPGTPPNPAVLCCLLGALWGDAVQWGPFHALILLTSRNSHNTLSHGSNFEGPGHHQTALHSPRLGQNLRGDFQEKPWEKSTDTLGVFSWLKEHVEEQVLFKEAGALTRALSDQVRSTDIGMRAWAVEMACLYAKATHQGHRLVYIEAIRGNLGPGVSDQIIVNNPEQKGIKASLTPIMNKALSASFLSICMVFVGVLSEDTSSSVSPSGIGTTEVGLVDTKLTEMEVDKLQCAVYAVEALAFMDFTSVHMAEYGRLVHKAVSIVVDSQWAVEALASRISPYEEVISGPGWEIDTWQLDAVHTSCIYFWMRVLMPCLPKLQPPQFADSIASTLFLYLCHPQEVVVLSAHSLFAAFLKESAQNVKVEQLSEGHHSRGVFHKERNSQGAQKKWLLLEQLSVHYAEEALKWYPASTPFKGLLSGIVAIALYLPAGSPACAICLRLVSERSFSLFTSHQQKVHDKDSRGGEKHVQEEQKSEGDGDKQHGEAGGKLRSLLMAVIPIVDLQVLSVCLQEVARLLLLLTAEGQSQAKALAELYEVLAASDDYTRKPFTVPFFQSLSYLCAVQEAQQAVHGRNGRSIKNVSSRKRGNRGSGGKSGGRDNQIRSSVTEEAAGTDKGDSKDVVSHDPEEEVERGDNERTDRNDSLKMNVASETNNCDDESRFCRYSIGVDEIEGNSVSGGYAGKEDGKTFFSRREERREPRTNRLEEGVCSPRHRKTMSLRDVFQDQSRQLVGDKPDQLDFGEYEENLVFRSTTSSHEPALGTSQSSGIMFRQQARQSRL